MSVETACQKLGIVAGGGHLPAQLIETCRRRGIIPVVVALKGQADPALPADMACRMGSAGKAAEFFKSQNVRDIVLIGAVKRPTWMDIWPDWFTLMFFIKLGIKSIGDDGLLKSVRWYLESHGFRLHAIQTFLPEIVMTEGTHTRRHPDFQEMQDIHLGLTEAKAHGAQDLGQAVIVYQGQVIAREDKRGTNVLIRKGVPGSILVKTAKPGQDTALDLPTIGVKTIELCAEMKFAGIVVEAGSTLFVHAAESIARANAENIFIVGVKVHG
ncbi:MAG: UDP-2,3-diacylglucosamine diphosphatase LpxI [Alphaproteobacteria bacterium]|nr:UDP-2,3-diacylglucosamine diphosphatase LpxI [Alphaproteobacteria bacterium]